MRDLVSLITACIDGNPTARNEFVNEFHRAIAAMIIKTCSACGSLDPAVVEDRIQDTYVRLFEDDCRRLRQLTVIKEDTIFGWVQSVAFSSVMDKFRTGSALKRGGRTSAVSLEIVRGTARTPNPESEYEERLLIQKIADLMVEITASQTGERDRHIFDLYMDGHSSRSISEMEGIGLGEKGVESVIHRLKTELRVRMVSQATALRQRKQA